jgi:hypothetical protein
VTIDVEIDQARLKELHHVAFVKDKIAFGLTGTAAFLLSGGAILGICGSLCFLLPGVNAIQDIVIKIYLPAGCSLGVGLCFAYGAVRASVPKNRTYNQLIDFHVEILNEAIEQVDLKKRSGKKELHLFVANNFLNPGWTPMFNQRFSKNIKEKFSTDEKKVDKKTKKRNEAIADAIDKALQHTLCVKNREEVTQKCDFCKPIDSKQKKS